jgi:nitroimidazol reductase NimA-like FMN-containing flavoprotein (pyridoxamine 5'-phosphate oxidase superfamily)
VTLDRNGLEILSKLDCLNLLDGALIGRLAVSVGALPVILPVNFTVIDGDIVIRTTPGTKLDAAATNSVVAFEVDGFDPVHPGGWSVLVQGVAEEVTDPDDLRRLNDVGLAPWSGANGRFVRIGTRIVSGRRMVVNGAVDAVR